MRRRSLLPVLLWPALLACDGASLTEREAMSDPWNEVATAEQAATVVCGDLGHITGIDVSKWQGEIDWDAVAGDPDVDFVFMRASIGTSADSYIYRNWSEAARVGIPRGAYHYLYAERSGTDQANTFVDTLESYGGYLPTDLPPVIDVEGSGNESATAADFERTIREFATVIEARLGRPPMIYTGHSWEGYGITGFGEYELWTPHYYWPTVSCPRVPNSWDDWRFWQYSDSGSVDGISGNVDLDHFNGTEAEFIAWMNVAAPDWWCEPIDRLHAEGILSRTCDQFASSTRFSRAEVAKMVGAALRIEETPAFNLCPNPFTDVPSDAWYVHYSSALAALGYADGTTVFAADGTFEPDATPTRCEMVKVIVEGWDIADGTTTPTFSDVTSAPSWCQPLLQSAVSAGIIVNTTDAFRPNDEATPGEVAAMIVRAMDTIGRTYPATRDFVDPACWPSCTSDDAEPNDTAEAAFTLAPGTHSGLAACADDDWYSVAASGNVELNVLSTATELAPALTDGSGAVIATPTRSADGYHYIFDMSAGDIVRLYIPAQRAYPATYTVQIVADGVCTPACPACTTTPVADGCGGECAASCDTTCDGDVCRAPCPEICVPDEGACDGDLAQRCQADALGCYDWVTTEDCAPSFSGCYEGLCCSTRCTPGEHRCIVDTFDTCVVVDGCPAWQTEAECSGDLECTLEGCVDTDTGVGVDVGVTREDTGIPTYTASQGAVGGCSAAPTRRAPWGLGLLALVAWRRRRR